MPDLWSDKREYARKSVEPLASRMRPRTLDEFAGQEHIVGPGRLLRRMIDSDTLSSVIFHGPPGTGKTALAEIVARTTGRAFERENAAHATVKRVREIIETADRRLGDSGRRTVLFLDEIHRFSKSQQDVLLADVERGLVTLVGATTENPVFTVNAALISRSTLFRFEPLSGDDIARLVRAAIADPQRGFGARTVTITDDAVAHWSVISDGDARRALTALEVAVLSSSPDGAGAITIDRAVAEESIQRKAINYSSHGDEHYDAISAMIKSVRGSDPDAAVYWIAVMLEGGEDPRFIARRLAILASEDIGNADPRGVMIADAMWSLVERIGMPEARIPLSQCATYLALAPKSNAAYRAINEALDDVREGRTRPVPIFLKDPTKAVSAGSDKHGDGYDYNHSHDANTSIGHITQQQYLGVDKRYYRPRPIGHEIVLAERLDEILRARKKPSGAGQPGAG